MDRDQTEFWPVSECSVRKPGADFLEKMVSELDGKEFSSRGNLGTWYLMTWGSLVKGLEGSALCV